MARAAPVAGRFTPRAWAAFIGCTLIWGSTWIVIRGQLGDVPPSWSVTWRFALGAGVMVALCLATGKSLRLTPKQHGFALLVAITQFVLNFNLVYRSELYVTSGLVSLTFAFLLVTNSLFAALFLGQRVTGRFLLGSAIGLIGVALLFAPELARPGGDNFGYGLMLAFAGVLSASIANVLQATRFGRSMPLEAGLAWAMAWGAMIDAAVAFSLYYMLIRTVGPGQAAWNGVVVPMVAMGISTVVEGFQWSASAFAGVALAIVGLVIALKAKTSP